jgi:hypothetical protein
MATTLLLLLLLVHHVVNGDIALSPAMATSGCDDSSRVLTLRLPDGRSLTAPRRALVGASPVIRAALKRGAAAAPGRPPGSQRPAPTALPSSCTLAQQATPEWPGGGPGPAPGLLVGAASVII